MLTFGVKLRRQKGGGKRVRERLKGFTIYPTPGNTIGWLIGYLLNFISKMGVNSDPYSIGNT